MTSNNLLIEENRPLRNWNNNWYKIAGWKFNCNIYDKETGKIFGRRTAKEWGLLIIFYIIFYHALAALVAICMAVLHQTLDPRIPKRLLSESAIGDNPGMGFRPMPIDPESTLIWVEGSDEDQFMPWVVNLMTSLAPYYAPGIIEKGNDPLRKCTFLDPPPRIGERRVCNVEVRSWGNCSYERSFNYDRSSPCIFVKLNRIYAWTPEYYQVHELPNEMPYQLKQHIKFIDRYFPERMKTVWVSCEGETAADVEFLGALKYYPEEVQGFPGYYFPYNHSEGYLSPLVAVQVLKPLTGIVINIECKAWAKNIRHSRRDKRGLVHFELLIQ